MNREYSDAENVKPIDRETLVTRVEHLEQAIKELFIQQQKMLEDMESHHIRLGRTERETGLLP